MVNAILQQSDDNSNTITMDVGFLEDALVSVEEFSNSIPSESESAIDIKIKHKMSDIIKLINESLVDVTTIIQNNMRGKSQIIDKKVVA